jgi:hypothetical protein
MYEGLLGSYITLASDDKITQTIFNYCCEGNVGYVQFQLTQLMCIQRMSFCKSSLLRESRILHFPEGTWVPRSFRLQSWSCRSLKKNSHVFTLNHAWWSACEASFWNTLLGQKCLERCHFTEQTNFTHLT